VLPASLLLRGPGGCSPRRRLPRGASSRSRGVGRCRRDRPGQQARHGVGRRCPAGGVHPSGLGVRDPAVQPSGVWSPGVVVQRVQRRPSAVHRPAVRCPAVRCPAVWCLPGRSGRVRLLPLRRWRWGPRSRWPGDPDHRNRWRPRWLPGRRRLDRRSRRPGRGRRCRRRVGQGGRWRTRAAGLGAGRGGRACRPSDQPGPAGIRSAPSRAAARWARGAGCSARWRHRTRGWRPRLGGRPRCVVVAEPDGRVGGPGGPRGGADRDGRAAPARPRPAASAPSSAPAAL
jgi:hypothetical protein